MSTERGTTNPFETALDRTPANYTPLTPLTFIERAAAVWPDHPSVIHGGRRFIWTETYTRCRRLASALAKRGIGVGDCVAVFAPNVPQSMRRASACRCSGRCSTPSTSDSTRRPSRSSWSTARRRRCSPIASSRRWSRTRSPGWSARHWSSTSTMPSRRAGSVSARSSTRRSSKTVTRSSHGRAPATNGAPSPSTTPRAPPGIRRASSTTTAARTSTRSRTSSAGTSRIIPSTCGPCRCSTATDGASRGRWRRSAGPASARARWRPARSTRRSPAKG